MFFKNTNKGFTLLEILVAIVVISIVTINIMPILTKGLESIYSANKDTENLFKSEGEMQYNIADKIVYKEVEVPIKFKNKDNPKKIKGGLVQSGNLYSFVASVPTIKINPSVLTEGYKPSTKVTIQGNNTHFNNESDLNLLDKNKFPISNLNYLYNHNLETSITLKLDRGLVNSKSPYIIKIKTERDIGMQEIEPEIVRAKLQINPPNFIAVGGEGEILVSASGQDWTKRSNPASKRINSTARINNRYIIADDAGNIFSLVDDKGWKSRNTNLKKINDLILEESDGNKWVWAIGKRDINYNFPIIRKRNGQAWEEFKKIDASQEGMPDEFLTGAISTDNKEMFFVGKGSIYFYDKASDTINMVSLTDEIDEEIQTTDITITDIAHGNETFVFIGKDSENNRIILTFDNNHNWNLAEKSSQDLLKTVTWSSEYDMFIAVGNNATLLSSPNGDNWEKEHISIDNRIDLHSVNSFKYDDKPLLLLGGKSNTTGHLYYSNNEADLTDLNKCTGNKIKSILSLTSRY